VCVGPFISNYVQFHKSNNLQVNYIYFRLHILIIVRGPIQSYSMGTINVKNFAIKMIKKGLLLLRKPRLHGSTMFCKRSLPAIGCVFICSFFSFVFYSSTHLLLPLLLWLSLLLTFLHLLINCLHIIWLIGV
jgi:hypothetical protein